MQPLKDLLLGLIVLFSLVTYSQSTEIPELTKKDSTIVGSWIVGIGFNIVDDSDDRSNKVFDINAAWNAVPYPSRISLGKYFKSGFGLEAIASYNLYKKDKIVVGEPNLEDKPYYSIDTRLSYDLNKIIGETGWFDPYIGVGVGFTHANNNPRGTYNGVLGFRTWFSDRIGLDFNTSGKWTMDSHLTNHIQHAVGVVYRFKAEKELTKKGKDKLELIESLENEIKRVNDSIAFADKIAEEKRLLAEKQEKEKELERRAIILKENRTKEKEAIQRKLDALDKIYFDFDASTLSVSAKNILSDVISILNDHPKLVIKITSNTDSRGSSKYNQKLSERRLQSILEYLINKGVQRDRFEGKAYGENNLVNECDDSTKCPNSKHRLNRRSEFIIIKF